MAAAARRRRPMSLTAPEINRRIRSSLYPVLFPCLQTFDVDAMNSSGSVSRRTEDSEASLCGAVLPCIERVTRYYAAIYTYIFVIVSLFMRGNAKILTLNER